MTGDKNAKEQLASFIAKFDPEVARLAEAILRRMRLPFPPRSNSSMTITTRSQSALLPLNGLRGDLLDCALSKMGESVFPAGKELPDPGRILRGSGTVPNTSFWRHLKCWMILPSRN